MFLRIFVLIGVLAICENIVLTLDLPVWGGCVIMGAIGFGFGRSRWFSRPNR